VDARARCDAATPFGEPVPVLGLWTIGAVSVDGLRLSASYTTGFFQASGRSDSRGGFDLYMATRAGLDSPFESVMPILGGPYINTSYDEMDPSVSGNGLTLVFSRADVGLNPAHLYQAARVENTFTGVQLVPNVNGDPGVTDQNPFLLEDGKALYFASSRNPQNSTDIYRAAWSGSSFEAPVPVRDINEISSELDPVVTPEDSTIYFASDRSDGRPRNSSDVWIPNLDIWVATRISANGFSTPRNVSELNTAAQETPTFVSSDGCTLYFTSTRSGTLGPYVATKRPP